MLAKLPLVTAAMKLNFTINYILDTPSQSFTAEVTSVETPEGDVLTSHFLIFCTEQSLRLTTEDEIRTAAYEYGKRYYG